MASAATISTSAMPGAQLVRRLTRPTAPMTEAEAVALAREGDHAAFKVLVEGHQQRVHALALRILKDPELARDAAQEAFLKAYRNLRRFEGRSAFGTWMYRLTYNHCLDMIRRDRSAQHVEFDEERVQADSSSVPSARSGETDSDSPEHALMRGELRVQLTAAIEQLPEESRQTLLLREVDGLAYAEIAQILGIPKGTVMSRLHHARRKLRALLEEVGVRPGQAPTSPQETTSKPEGGST